MCALIKVIKGGKKFLCDEMFYNNYYDEMFYSNYYDEMFAIWTIIIVCYVMLNEV